jgi:acyl-coenzyme A synthetase/AMP-(fatty) acid ligase
MSDPGRRLSTYLAPADRLMFENPASGTTGRPKGTRRPLLGGPLGTYPDTTGRWLRELLGFSPGDTYFLPSTPPRRVRSK